MDVDAGVGHSWKPRVVAAFVGLLGLSATLFAAQLTQEAVDTKQRADFENRFHQGSQAITDRLLATQEAINGMQALFSVTEVDRNAFRTFIAGATEREGVQALEFVRAVPTWARGRFESEVRADTSLHPGGYPGFTVSPQTTYPDMFVVDYVEPMEGNEPAFGFDLGSNEARREAIEHARDTGEMVASEAIQLVQDDRARTGFLLMLPVYERGVEPTTSRMRQQAFEGVVAGVFVLEELLTGAPGFDSGLSLRVRDLGHMGEHEVPTNVIVTPGFDADAEILSRSVVVGDRNWSIDATDSSPASGLTDALPPVVMAIGTVLTIAVAIAAASILGSRDRAEAAAAEATADLTKQAEQLRAARDKAREADKLKSTFLTSMSHELRTPLNGVIGLSSVLIHQGFGSLNEKQLETVEQIQSSGDHLLHLIDDLLDLARIEAGREKLRIEGVPLSEAVDSALEVVRVDAMTRGVTLHTPSEAEAVSLRADERKLHQVLLNLLSNAIKFTEDGGSVGVDITTRGKTATFEVWDTGIGIPSSEIDNLFIPFHQVDSPLGRTRRGTGLGLTLTREIVEIHGGTIRVESEEGVGSRFIVSWPRSGSADPRRDIEHAPIDTDLSGLRVLAVDDSSVNRMVMVDMLSSAGCEQVEEAITGREAVAMARRLRPHLILLDIQLPFIDGLEVARILRSDPDLAETRLLAVTAQALPEEIERIREAGIDGYLAKPFKRSAFLNAVNSVVEALTEA